MYNRVGIINSAFVAVKGSGIWEFDNSHPGILLDEFLVVLRSVEVDGSQRKRNVCHISFVLQYDPSGPRITLKRRELREVYS